MHSALKIGLGLLTAVALHALPANAQSGSVNATATVLAAITVTGNNNLAFGNVSPTQTKIVAPATGGKFTVAGSSGAGVSLTFTLPANLGAAAVAIGTWTGVHNNVADNPATGTSFTPSGSATNVTLGALGVFVYFGATLTTTAATPGAYTAPVTLTVAYT